MDDVQNRQIEIIARALCAERGRDPDEETSLYPVDGEGAAMDIVVNQWECWRQRAEAILLQIELLNAEKEIEQTRESIRRGARRSDHRFKL